MEELETSKGDEGGGAARDDDCNVVGVNFGEAEDNDGEVPFKTT